MSELDEKLCPWCNGIGGAWEFHIVKRNKRDVGSEIGSFEKCRGCYGLGQILRQAPSGTPVKRY